MSEAEAELPAETEAEAEPAAEAKPRGTAEAKPKGFIPLTPVGNANTHLNGSCMTSAGAGGGSTCDNCDFIDDKMSTIEKLKSVVQGMAF